MLEWIQKVVAFDSMCDPATVEPGMLRLLRDSCRDCARIYKQTAQRYITDFPELLSISSEQFEEQMHDLHCGVLLKTLIDIAHCDRRWSDGEKLVAREILKHVWGVHATNETMQASLQQVVEHTSRLKWVELIRPIVKLPDSRDELNRLRVVVLRLANIISKADGDVSAQELKQLECIRREFEKATVPKQIAADPGVEHRRVTARPIADDISRMQTAQGTSKQQGRVVLPATTTASAVNGSLPCPQAIPVWSAEQRKILFDNALHELNSLIGLDAIKQDVAQLIDFLQVQLARRAIDLPSPTVSLHAIFSGNPGTGKTTVARIIGHLMAGLSILHRGHTIEVDRSALVAHFAGQTAPKTHQCLDQALDGVLFIDEAYSLVTERGDDAFGTEAIQVLLKRMEDDRNRLIVVLAGHPDLMQQMLKSNPGLTSRFQRTLNFPDYDAKELLQIFHRVSKQNHYRLPKATQKALYVGFQKLLDSRDEHFGNGRVVRNLFENAIRRMATRIVRLTPLTREVLTTLLPEDIDFQVVQPMNGAVPQ